MKTMMKKLRWITREDEDPKTEIFLVDHPKPAVHAMVPELGTLEFISSLAEARTVAQMEAKPIFLLFQEIPGCSTCTNFGNNVLSDPIIRDFLRDEFVACVVNNRGQTSEDRATLKRFNEPYLNNPVVRFVNGNEAELVARASGIYNAHGILVRMIAAFQKIHQRNAKKLPEYVGLYLRELELSINPTAPYFQSIVFSMGCC